MNEYFEGKKLWGDDFSKEEIEKWYEDEKEGYSGLIENSNYSYAYHELNKFHGYTRLKHIKQFPKALSFGGATGDELLPILKKINKITIVEPSKKLRTKEIYGKKINYITPSINGKLKIKSESFDLITCFGVLHHIPNVSFVFRELIRVLKKDGIILIREPIVSMGDWNNPRKGLTKRERGIPLEYFKKIIKENNLEVISEHKVLFPLTRRLNFGKGEISNFKLIIWMDYILSKIFFWNNKYHAKSFFDKLRPQSIFYVLKKK